MNKYRELAEKLTPEQNRLWAIACAELVLPIFEEKYPDDDRPRLAIEAAKNKSPDAYAAYAAAADAAYHAADAAAAAAWAAYYAARAAAWAAYAYADDAAAYAADAADAAEKASGKTEQEILQLGER